MNTFLQKLSKLNIIECFAISFITGWLFYCICISVPDHISDLNYVTRHSLIHILGGIFPFFTVTMVVYFFYAPSARIIMFLSVMIFSTLCAYNSSKISFDTNYTNADGQIFFCVFMCIVVILTFMYVKNDCYALIQSYHLTTRKMLLSSTIIGIALIIFVSLLGIYRYLSFSNSTFDYGIFTQMYEHMANDFTPVTTLERNMVLSHFAVHFSPIYYIALPFYMIFRHAISVNIIQAIMLGLPIIPLIMLGKKFQFSNKLILSFVLLYALYPATACGSEYDMHENCFLIFMIFFTIYGIETGNNLIFAIFMFLTMMVKEDAPIYILVLGLYLIFSNRKKIRGLIMLLSGGTYFIIVSAFMKANGLGIMDNRFKNLYYDEDGSLFQIVHTLIANPVYVISQFVHESPDSVSKTSYIILMLAPVILILIMTGKHYSRYLLLIPFILINLIPTYSYMHNICFQYNFGPLALIFYILILNANDLKSQDYSKLKSYISVGVLCDLILFSAFVFPYLTRYSEKYHNNKDTYQKIETCIRNLNPAGSVSASGFYTPHLYRHMDLYDQTHTDSSVNRNTQYLVIDTYNSHENEKFKHILQSNKYELIYFVEGWIEIYELKK